MKNGWNVAVLLCFTISVAAQAAGPSSPRLSYYYPVPPAKPPQTVTVDVCVYGGTPGGVTSAIQAARMGKKAVLVVFGRHVGGLTSGGLTATDIGNQAAIGGLAAEFYKRVGRVSKFRPSQAEATFLAMLKDAGVPVYFEHRLKTAARKGTRIVALECENGNTFRAGMFVDATYEGDLFAAAGVSYFVGREGNAVYREKYNGMWFRGQHQIVTRVDPFQKEGDPRSGLLWGVSPEPPGKPGMGDKRVQAYNFRMWLTNAPDRLPFPQPENYDRNRYLLLLRYLRTQDKPAMPFQLQNGDCNNLGGFSTDYIGGSHLWPEGDYETRERVFQDHVNYQQGLVWFMANDPEVPEALRSKIRGFGLPRNEFVATGGWPHQLYIREGRRMISEYVMTDHNCQGQRTVEDSVGLAAYTMDSHSCQRIVIDGAARNEGCIEIPVKRPYPISYRSIVPREAECTNLLVPVCLSASHIAYGSIRMEPVFMILGQSAGTAAVMAIDGGISVQKVAYPALRERLLANKQVLDWNTNGVSAERTTSGSGPAGTTTSGPAGIEVDDQQARIEGNWTRAAAASPFVGQGYLHDDNSNKGEKSAVFSAELPSDGEYDIYLCWSRNQNRATNVPVEIAHAGGAEKVVVNQRTKGGWVKVFSGRFAAGNAGSVTIRTDGTDGHVIVDAARWVPVNR